MSSKNAQLETKLQKYKGRVVRLGGHIERRLWSLRSLTEQGSSASQMTTAEVMDDIARLAVCDGQAADAVSVYTQVKIGGCSTATKNSQIRMFGCMDTSSKT